MSKTKSRGEKRKKANNGKKRKQDRKKFEQIQTSPKQHVDIVIHEYRQLN